MTTTTTEFDRKQIRLHTLLREHNLDALLLQRVSSFAWATCGAASYVNTATTNGAAALLLTPSGRYLITNNIEWPRLEQEERLGAQGWQPRIVPWHEAQATVVNLTRGLRLGADGAFEGAVDLSAALARQRALLEPEEVARFRVLGRLCAETVGAVAHAIRPGQTEHQIAACLAYEARCRGVQPIVNLVATDERIYAFRHPLPTDKVLERYAMLVLCGRWRGLVCSMTRFVHFGYLPEDLRRKSEAVAKVDGAFIVATRPGRTLGEVFQRAKSAYEAVGFSEEWRHHHQGGPAGYEPREYLATPASTDVVSAGQVFAWNPSIKGTKSEDTVLVGESGKEVLTAMEGWPALSVAVEDEVVSRPAILEIV